ncbi:hypothetical protein SEA_VANLEE_156 [Gordonia phage VanLee]|uniref:Uncharacterized protein n=1 Tax=Gordonia phage VanLee TaxID=2845816 RepID=A0A8F2D9M0_9CAUD|nr:hypothetical protein QEH49_gp134 [Gordonia phage VanLee]QWS68272.1 hypothetical protein SEA_VANLEE_156 [Gordonia phage VanLee]
MDPDAALTEIRRLTDRLGSDVDEEARELAARFSALDEWICRGGFLPSAWQR